MGVNVSLMVFEGEWVCMGVCVCMCASVFPLVVCASVLLLVLPGVKATAVNAKRLELLPCSYCCVVLLSECAVILSPNVCVCVRASVSFIMRPALFWC